MPHPAGGRTTAAAPRPAPRRRLQLRLRLHPRAIVPNATPPVRLPPSESSKLMPNIRAPSPLFRTCGRRPMQPLPRASYTLSPGVRPRHWTPRTSTSATPYAAPPSGMESQSTPGATQRRALAMSAVAKVGFRRRDG